MALRRSLPLLGRLAVALPLLLSVGFAHPDVSVRAERGRISIQAHLEPLADVLARFAQATGAEVVYEAVRPRQVVSVGIDAGSEAEALSQLLEGQGLNYVLRLDGNGRDVQMVVISGTAAAAAPAGRPATGRTLVPPPESPPEFEPTDEEPEPFTPASIDEGGDPGSESELAVPAPQGFLPGGASGTPGENLPSPTPGSPAEPGITPPQVPQPASHPGPAPPHFPGPASYPGAPGS